MPIFLYSQCCSYIVVGGGIILKSCQQDWSNRQSDFIVALVIHATKIQIQDLVLTWLTEPNTLLNKRSAIKSSVYDLICSPIYKSFILTFWQLCLTILATARAASPKKQHIHNSASAISGSPFPFALGPGQREMFLSACHCTQQQIHLSSNPVTQSIMHAG